MQVLRGPVRELHAVAISPDGTEIAACGGGPLSVWAAGKRRDVVPDGVSRVDYTPDGHWLLYRWFLMMRSSAGRGETYTTDPANGLYALDRHAQQPPHRLTDGFLLAAFGDRLLARDEGGVVCLLVTDRPPFPVAWRKTNDGVLPVVTAAFLPDGRAVVHHRGPAGHSVLSVYAADTGAEVDRLTVPAGRDGVLLPSPDGEWLVLSEGNWLVVWRLADRTAPPETVSLGRKQIRKLVWHPSGAHLLGVGTDGAVRRIEADSWAVTATYTWPAGKARCVAISPDGLTAAAGTSRGAVVRFDLD